MTPFLAAAAMLATPDAALPREEPITAPGPHGDLAGTWQPAGAGAPVVLIIPGSGPTDRDGDNPLGVTARPYRLLAEALAGRGVASVRIDKRGMFGSKAAIADANDVILADYARDVHTWIEAIRARTKARCVWVAGHSEGGLVALAAAQQPTDLCGLILISAPGRRLDVVMREQFHANPANAPILGEADSALDALAAGRDVDVTALHPALQRIFAPAVQGFLKSLFAADPARMIAGYRGRALIVQGDRDIQVATSDAEALHAAQPASTLTIVPGMNHVLKAVAADDRAANLATYSDSSLPLAPGIADAIAGFVTR